MLTSTCRKWFFSTTAILIICINAIELRAFSQDDQITSRDNSAPTKLRDLRFGTSFSFCTLLAEDGVSKPSNNSSEMMIGFKFGSLLAVENSLPWLFDLEVHFGSADRSFYGHYNSGVLFSLQAFGGLNFNLGHDIFFAHTMIGLNYLHIGASDSYVQKFHNDIYYYGTDGFSRYMASIFNSWNRAQEVYVNGFPAHSRIAPALNLGLEIRVRENMALTGEYMPLFDGRIRSDFRLSFAFIFNLTH